MGGGGAWLGSLKTTMLQPLSVAFQGGGSGMKVESP